MLRLGDNKVAGNGRGEGMTGKDWRLEKCMMRSA